MEIYFKDGDLFTWSIARDMAMAAAHIDLSSKYLNRNISLIFGPIAESQRFTKSFRRRNHCWKHVPWLYRGTRSAGADGERCNH